MTDLRTDPAEAALSRPADVPKFAVISGAQVQHALQGREEEVVETGRGDLSVARRRRLDQPAVVLPQSPGPPVVPHRCPTRVDRRAGARGWSQVDLQLPRQRGHRHPEGLGVLILNDHDTGYPFACVEGSIISATRTAASAALAADWLSRGRPRPNRVGFIGVGLIARYIHTFLVGTGWAFDEIGVHDLSTDSQAGFRGYLEQSGADRTGQPVRRRRNVDPIERPGGLRHRRQSAPRAGPVVVRAQPAGAPRVPARPRAGDTARLDQHRRRRRALPEGQHLSASDRTAHG